MHLSFADLLSLLSVVTLVGALVFTALQVRQASQGRRDQSAIAMLQTALSENSAWVLELLGTIPEGSSARAIEELEIQSKRAVIEFGLRLEVMGYMVFRGLVDITTANDLAGGTILGYWARVQEWVQATREHTGHDEFLEWCEWLAHQISRRRAQRPYVPAYREYADWNK